MSKDQFGAFDGDPLRPQDDETLVEFYLRLREDELNETTQRGFQTAFEALDTYIQQEDIDSLFDMNKKAASNWCDWMIYSDGLQPSTAERYIGDVAQVVDRLKTDNYIGGTQRPFEKVRTVYTFDYDDEENWPEIPYDEFVLAIRKIERPRRLVIVVVSAKTGVRIAELSNLDERDINISHPMSSAIDDPRPEIADKPNSIYVDSSIIAGKEFNGEIRDRSNKEKSHRAVPIDQETADVLGWYLAGRTQPSSPANPILTGTGGPGAELGDRLGVRGIEDEVNAWAKKNGWRESEPTVSHHFLRHWYVTQMRDLIDPDDIPIGTPKTVVKGLRGDSDADTIDTYTHEWTEGLKNDYPPYGEAIASFLPKFF